MESDQHREPWNKGIASWRAQFDILVLRWMTR